MKSIVNNVSFLLIPEKGLINSAIDSIKNTIEMVIDSYKEDEIIEPDLKDEKDDSSFEIISNHQNKILVAEDNPMIQKMISKVLQEIGFEVDVVENGATALRLLKKHKYSVFITDLNMPIMDGFEAVEKVRSELKLGMPIIGISSNILTEERKKCLDAGMNEYISKPFEKKEIINTLSLFIPGLKKETIAAKETSSVSLKKLYNLEYLEQVSKGNVQFRNEMIEFF